MSTLIVGCGYLGRRVGQRLALRQETVHGTTRRETTGPELAKLGIAPVLADVLDPDSLSRIPDCDRVLYCVGFDRSTGIPMRTVYVEGLRNVIQALADKPRRIVYASATSVYGRNDGGWVDEESPTEPVTDSGRVCLDAENIGRSLAAEYGLELVILRYSGLYGAGRIMRRAGIERGEPIAGDPEKWLNLIHIDDATSAAITAFDRGVPGRVYLASDDRPVKRLEFYKEVARGIDAPIPRFITPEPGSPEARREEANKRVSNRRITSELGLSLTYPTIFEGLPAVIDEERFRGVEK